MTVITREQTSRNRIGTRGRWIRKITNGGIDYKYPKIQWTAILAQRSDMVEVNSDGEPLGALPQDSKKSLVELLSKRDALDKEIQMRVEAGEIDPRASVAADAEAFLNATPERREIVEKETEAIESSSVTEEDSGPSEIDRIKAQLEANRAAAEANTIDTIEEAPREPEYVGEDPEMWGVDLYDRDALIKYGQALGMKIDGRSVRDCATAISKVKRRKRDLWSKMQKEKTKG